MGLIQVEEAPQLLRTGRVTQLPQRLRLDRLAEGNPGDVKPVGEGVSELRIDHGPGYRVYFAPRGKIVIVLLCGGDKSSQQRDITRARRLLAELE